MKTAGLALSLSLFSITALGAEDKKAAAAAAAAAAAYTATLPPEVRKTVDAMVGNWVFEGTITGMAKGPVKVKEPFACKKVARGRVVHCSGKTVIAGVGPVEDEALVTWNVDGKALRFVSMSSTGEVHDHTCDWKDEQTVICWPVSITLNGQPATVDLTMTWLDAKTMTITETTNLRDGAKIVFEAKGKR